MTLLQVPHRIALRSVDAVAAQKREKTVLVAGNRSSTDFAWQEQILAESLPRPRQALNIGINGWNDEMQTFRLHDPPQHLAPFRVVGGRDNVISVGVGFLQRELVVVTANDKGSIGARSHAADQIVARSVTRVRKQQSRSHPILLIHKL